MRHFGNASLIRDSEGETAPLTASASTVPLTSSSSAFPEIENGKLSFGEFPSDDLIVKLASALDSEANELLILAEKNPDAISERVLPRPDTFRKLAIQAGRQAAGYNDGVSWTVEAKR